MGNRFVRPLRDVDADRGVLAEVYEERRRQAQHGYDPAHDDSHDADELAIAALVLIDYDAIENGPRWAYDLAHKTREDRRKQLVIAAALLVAEIGRLDRVAGRSL